MPVMSLRLTWAMPALLLFAACDPVHNNAVALREYLLRASKIALEEIGDEPE